MHLHVEIQRQKQDRGVEHRIQPPCPDPIATPFQKVHQQDPNVAHNVAAQKQDLAADHEGEARAGEPDGGPEAVPVDDGVDGGGEEDGEDLEGLGKFEPEEGHEDEDGLVEEAEEGEVAAAQDGEVGPEGVEEAGEVEGVGPEEDAARGAGAEGEAEEPLERGRLGAAGEEPAGVADLGGGGEEGAGEDGGGEEGHGEGVEGGDGAEGDGLGAGQEGEEEVEREGEEEVERDGGEEEGPGGAVGLGVAPPEVDDRGVLREVVRQGVDHPC